MADDRDTAAARAVLREHGVEVHPRGRLSADQWEEYGRIMTAAGDDYPAGDDYVTDLGDPPPAAPPPPVPGGTAGRPAAEQRPRRIRQPGAAARVRELWHRGDRGDRGGRAKPRRAQKKKPPPRPEQPWRPTAGIIETGWSRFAQAAGGIPPLQRVLAAQAPMAGVVFEGTTRGTVIDRVVLQRAARWQAQGEAVAALLGVPGFVLLTAAKGRCEVVQTPDGPRPMITQDGMPVWDQRTETTMIMPLKYCLMSWLAVSARTADEVTRQAEETIRLGAQADQIIAWIFSPPPPPGTRFADVASDAREHAAGFTAAAAGPPPPDPGPPPPGNGSSAFYPALTASVLPP